MKEIINYNTSKIYKLCLKNNIQRKEDYNDYIGFSTLPLNIILYNFENDYKRYLYNKKKYSKAFKLYNDYGIENIDIKLINNIDCYNLKELKLKYHNFISSI